MTRDEMDADAVRRDILRFWNVVADDEQDAAAEAYEALDRATAMRRHLKTGPGWAEARLAEGLARLYVARQMADWGHRAYTIQAIEAAIDGLRDAAAHLDPAADPPPAEVAAFRERLLAEWRAAQSEPTLDRLAALSIPALRSGGS
jgi:hypothetical protein